MLKRICLAAIAGVTLSAAEIAALPFGNPLDATWLGSGVFWDEDPDDECESCQSLCDSWSFRIGYYGDFVFNRFMEVNAIDNDSSIRRMEIFTNAGYVAINVWNLFDLFGTLGASKLRIQTPESAFLITDAINTTFLIEFDTHFSWSIGARGTLWECGCLGIGIEGQYFSYDSDINFIDCRVPVYLEGADTRYREYQIGIGAAYQIPLTECGTLAVPYIGVKWAHARLNMGDFLTTDSLGNAVQLFKLHASRHTGFAVGVTLVGAKVWSVTAEARFIDELAAHVNSQIRF